MTPILLGEAYHFKKASDPQKVLCVALAYAKRKHVDLICDGNGGVLKPSFPVDTKKLALMTFAVKLDDKCHQTAFLRYRKPKLQ